MHVFGVWGKMQIILLRNLTMAMGETCKNHTQRQEARFKTAIKHSPLLGTQYQTWVMPYFANRKALVPYGMNSLRWKHSLDIQVHDDITAPNNCGRCVSCMFMLQISCCIPSLMCSIGFRPDDQDNHCSVLYLLLCAWNQFRKTSALRHTVVQYYTQVPY